MSQLRKLMCTVIIHCDVIINNKQNITSHVYIHMYMFYIYVVINANNKFIRAYIKKKENEAKIECI